MKNKIVEANICMVISKGFSGLNMNALKYLLPFWISPFTGVALRCVFAAVAFCILRENKKFRFFYWEPWVCMDICVCIWSG